MIAANELRIGNWLLFDGKPERVAMIDMDLDDESEALISSLENYSLGPFNLRHGKVLPIPLTPEILEKCGFEGIGSDFEINEVHIYSGHHEFWYWNDKVEVKLTSLHQLQNLYFALTGEELTVNL